MTSTEHWPSGLGTGVSASSTYLTTWFLATGFPLMMSAPSYAVGILWHQPENAHTELSVPDLWWTNLDPLFRQALRACGIDEDVHEAAVRGVRPHYCDHTRFHLYPETITALNTLREANWSTVILSNHVPELAMIVSGMGLDNVIDQVFTSALTGYEKPNPEAFRIALGDADPEKCFMVGDNPVADVLGAERVGIRGILVRGETSIARTSVPDLMSAADYILDAP